MHQSALGFAAICALAGAAQAGEPGKPTLTALTMRSGGPIDPIQAKEHIVHADLDLQLDPAKETLSGSATLTIALGADTDKLSVDLDRNYKISAIGVNGQRISAEHWSNPEGRLVIDLPYAGKAGDTLKVWILYAGTPHVAVRAPWDDGIVWARTADGQPWFSTTAQGYGCDLYWPCIDHPLGEIDGADIHLTVPRGLVALSSGVDMGRTYQSGADWVTWNWKSGQINPYLVSFNVGPYVEITDTYHSRFGNSFPMSLWVLKGHEAQGRGLFAEFAPTLDFFEAKIGPYPWADQKMGVVETPYLGMEHQTINAYGNGFKLAPEGFDWLFHHEFSHEWFGNQLTAADWDDFWLHEGFGSYMQPLYGEWREGQARYDAMMLTARPKILNAAPMVSGHPMDSEDVYDDARGKGPGGDIYYKGEWVLHTLRYLIGDKAFFDAIRRLVYGRPDPAPGNFKPKFGTSAEFAQDVKLATGRDYGWFFDVYLHRAALPELVETRTGDMLALSWKTPDDLPFPMPVDVEVDGKVQTVAMPDGKAVVSVPASAHVVIDPMARVLRALPALERMKSQQ